MSPIDLTGLLPLSAMRELVADMEGGSPVVRFHCPDCSGTVQRSYGVKHGAKVVCPECRHTILFTFAVEIVAP